MYERVPITGIRESLRIVEGPRTIIMPVLILAILTGLIVFYFRSEPRLEVGSDESAVATAAAPAARAETPNTPNLVSVPVAAPAAPVRELPIVTRAEIKEKEFTSWMSPLALDTYLRQKNRGYRGNYWSQGNWIRAIEGRWREGAQEFRIALGTMGKRGEIEWGYRINMTDITFAEELAHKGNDGYTLAQSQAFRHPDGKKRYQAVWQRAKSVDGKDR